MIDKDIYFHYKYFKSIYNSILESYKERDMSGEYSEIIEHMKKIYFKDNEWVESNVDIIFFHAKSNKEKCIDNINSFEQRLNEKLIENDEFELETDRIDVMKQNINKQNQINRMIIIDLINKSIQEYKNRRKESYEFLSIDIQSNIPSEYNIQKIRRMSIVEGFKEISQIYNFDFYYKYLRKKNEENDTDKGIDLLSSELDEKIRELRKYQKIIWGREIEQNSKGEDGITRDIDRIIQELEKDIMECKDSMLELEDKIDSNILKEITKSKIQKKKKEIQIDEFVKVEFKNTIYTNYIQTIVKNKMEEIIQQYYFVNTDDFVQKYIAQSLKYEKSTYKIDEGKRDKTLKILENKLEENHAINESINNYKSYIKNYNRLQLLTEAFNSDVLEQWGEINLELDFIRNKINQKKEEILNISEEMINIENKCKNQIIRNMINKYKEKDFKKYFFDRNLIFEELRLLHAFNDYQDVINNKQGQNSDPLEYHLNLIHEIINKIINELLEFEYAHYHSQLLNKTRYIFTNFDLEFRKEYDGNIKRILSELDDVELEKAQRSFDNLLKKVRGNEKFNYNYNQVKEYLTDLEEIKKIFDKYFNEVNKEKDTYRFDKIKQITISEFINNIFQLKVLLDSYKDISCSKREVNKKMNEYFWGLRKELKKHVNDIKNSGFEGYITMKEKQYINIAGGEDV
ncbi:hypothetical protein [Oceanirhabdus sp. W0125-5]|uniref:hypothetical protein n=1 Tax=Oceanirhabdus sp. W0125-5 TaxID=2999116 RepID=UPI0022F30974|nr:hypothetical protein [Oceanirhabdus sp. W0125-5]WBW98999.1 hypothetical protein OW730_09705 [Oceanirhabdus sp. W0125-5]